MFGMELIFDSLVINFLLGLFSVLLIYWYSIRNHDYWEKKGVRYAEPYPFIGSLFDALRKPLHEVECDRYNGLGRVYGHFEGKNPLISIGDPKLLREVLVKDFQFFTSRRIDRGDPVQKESFNIFIAELN
ncbi:uncharacterized protein NPIL_459741 [Nephila pilipes]|uniref:Cytochrome P450 n=1 Tax=Nephila pilipes TaxID=299642 RepID=A0A8X6U4G3_NEPPI|nr:uncharacterized protein NPIL_459741 [Nephila pilipes]